MSFRYTRCAICGGTPIMSRDKVECPRCGIMVVYGDRMYVPEDMWDRIQAALREASA